MAKEKFDRTKRDPNFKISDIPVVEGASKLVLSTMVDIAKTDKEIKKSEIADPTCTQAEEME